MNKFISILFITLAWSNCAKDTSNDMVCYTLSERQCLQDPYFAFIKENASSDQKIDGIKKFFNSKSIDLASITANAPFNGAVCLACSCPSGIGYTISVHTADTVKLSSLGLVLSVKSCND